MQLACMLHFLVITRRCSVMNGVEHEKIDSQFDSPVELGILESDERVSRGIYWLLDVFLLLWEVR